MSAATSQRNVDADPRAAELAWRVLSRIEDPELPALTLVDLGIVRFAKVRADGVLEVGLSPTYTGCPATDYIGQLVGWRTRCATPSSASLSRVTQVLAPGVEQRLDQRGRPPQAGGVRHRPAGRTPSLPAAGTRVDAR